MKVKVSFEIEVDNIHEANSLIWSFEKKKALKEKYQLEYRTYDAEICNIELIEQVKNDVDLDESF